jgi:branched-chain amino acid transport system substrate-binding protein
MQIRRAVRRQLPGNWRRRTVAVACVALLAGAAACGGDDAGNDDASSGDEPVEAGDEGVLGPADAATGDPVRIGFITDGKNATTDQSIDLEVADAAVQYLNEHRGGIAGRPIELVTCEAQLDPARGADCANQMVEEDVPLVAVGTTGVVDAVWEPLHDAGIPSIFYAANGESVPGDAETAFVISNPRAGTIQLPIDLAQRNDADSFTVVVIDVPAAVSGYEGPGAEAFEDAGIDLELVRVPPGTADMTGPVGEFASDDPGVVGVLGNDAFCISAFQALQTFGYEGPIATVAPCITDATRTAIPGDYLEGMVVSSPAPVGIEDESTELYRTVLETFGAGDVETTRISGVGTFLVFTGLDVGLGGLDGDITPESVIDAMKSMDEADLPGGGGLTIQCGGSAVPDSPAVCTDQGLYTTLDAEGQPGAFEVTGSQD